MTKKDIVKLVAEQTGISRRSAAVIVQKTLDYIVAALAEQGRLELRNFGVFEVETRAACKARNPITGEPVQVPAKEVVVFKSGKTLKKLIQHKKEKNS